MKKHILISTLIILAFVPQICLAQAKIDTRASQILDTIYANDTKNVALFFPEPIRQGITGSDNFVFTYNREKEQYFGLLQAKPGKESNLLIINKNGSIFSYIVRYKKQLSKLNYFIPKASSIGNEIPTKIDSLKKKTVEAVVDNNTFHYQKFCAFLLSKRMKLPWVRKRNKRVILNFERVIFDKDELYIMFQVENNSTLDYDVNFLKLYIETRQKGKKKSLQRLYIEPKYIYKLPTKIKEGQKKRFIYVLPKFSLSNDRRVIAELNEKNGERNVELKISHRYINYPN